jgi:hypothetical protein
VAVGDLLIIIVGNDDDTDTAQWDDSTLKPTGFTLISEAGDHLSDCHTAAFWRVADGTEGATVGVNSQAAANNWGIYYRVTGADTTSPIDATGADHLQVTGTTAAVTALTTTVEKALIFCAGSTDGLLVPVDSIAGNDWLVDYEVQSTAVGGIVALARQRWAGASDLCTFDWGGGSSNGFAGFQFAIAPRALTRQLDLGALQTSRPDLGALQSAPAGGVEILPTGIASTEAFGTPTMSIDIEATGIPASEAFGTPSLSARIDVGGIASTEAFGTPSLSARIDVGGIPASEVFGTPTMSIDIEATGIGTGEAFGTPVVSVGFAGTTILPDGIATGETFGAPVLSFDIEATGIGTGETFGTPAVSINIGPSGIPTSEGIGTPEFSFEIVPAGIASAEAFGSPTVGNTGASTIDLEGYGIVTSEAFGIAFVSGGAIPVGPRYRPRPFAPRFARLELNVHLQAEIQRMADHFNRELERVALAGLPEGQEGDILTYAGGRWVLLPADAAPASSLQVVGGRPQYV